MAKVPVVLHAFDSSEVLSADVAGGQREGVVLVRPLVDDQVVVLGKRSLAKAAFEIFNRRSTLPASRSNGREALRRGHRGALQRVDGEHLDEVVSELNGGKEGQFINV